MKICRITSIEISPRLLTRAHFKKRKFQKNKQVDIFTSTDDVDQVGLNGLVDHVTLRETLNGAVGSR